MTRLRWALLVASGAMLSVATGAHAAQDEAALQQQVGALKQAVVDLEARVAELERTSCAAKDAQSSSTSPSSVADASPAHEQAPPISAPPAAVSAALTPPASVSAPTPAMPAGYLSEEAHLKLNWSKIAREMNEDDVLALLGAPSKKAELDGRSVWYYYYPGTGAGSVFFTAAGHVSSRQSPFGFGW